MAIRRSRCVIRLFAVRRFIALFKNFSCKLLTTVGLLACTPWAFAGAGNVYFVIGSDTAVWNVAGGVNTSTYHNHFVPDLYIQPQMNGYRVMDPAFRNQFVDSYGQTMKLTWWMLVGSVYGLADNTDVPIPNQMPIWGRGFNSLSHLFLERLQSGRRLLLERGAHVSRVPRGF